MLPNARVQDLGAGLAAKSYQVFLQVRQWPTASGCSCMWLLLSTRNVRTLANNQVASSCLHAPCDAAASKQANRKGPALEDHSYILQPATARLISGAASSLTCPPVLGRVFPPFANRLQDGQLYAFKGLAGRLGPIGVHVALLMCLFGTGYSGFGGWKGTVLCPEGGEFVVANALYPASSISTLPKGSKAVMQVGAGLNRQHTQTAI